jgi:hypothetical protein
MATLLMLLIMELINIFITTIAPGVEIPTFIEQVQLAEELNAAMAGVGLETFLTAIGPDLDQLVPDVPSPPLPVIPFLRNSTVPI